MGAYLSAPVLTKALSAGETDILRYGGAAQQGWRLSMEDESVACLDVDGSGRTALFALFDGHGGSEVRAVPRTRRARAAAAGAPAPQRAHLLTPRPGESRADAAPLWRQVARFAERHVTAALRSAPSYHADVAGALEHAFLALDHAVRGPNAPRRFCRALSRFAQLFAREPPPRAPRSPRAAAPLTRRGGGRRLGRKRAARSWQSWRRAQPRRATTAPLTPRC